MDSGDRLRESLVLVLTDLPQDARAVVQALGQAGIRAQPCKFDTLAAEMHAGVGAVIIAEETGSAAEITELGRLIERQPSWSDVPLIILISRKRDASAYWRLIRNAEFLRNATILERPLRIETLLQAVRLAQRGREQQYRLRDQMLERERLLTVSEEKERSLSAVLNNTKSAVFFMNDRQQCTYMNAAAENLTGYSLAEVIGRPLHDAVYDTASDARHDSHSTFPFDSAFADNLQTGGEDVFVHKDGHPYPVAFSASSICEDTDVVGTVVEVRDISRQKADTERLHMLLNELNHRVKNTLANVQSIVLQSLKGEPVSAPAKVGIMSRLTALARSHDLLAEKSWISAPLRDVVTRALAPFGTVGDATGRLMISGDAFELRPNAALAIAMALHELATNAVKYGALSTERGSVDLAWTVISGSILHLRWVERGGPPVTPPVRTGFGRRLIETGIAHELAGDARISFDPAGLVCEIDLPLEATVVDRHARMGL